MSQPATRLQREAVPGHVPHEDQDLPDVAYIALGASQALEAWPSHGEAIDRFEGQLGYIQACIDQRRCCIACGWSAGTRTP